MILPNISLFQEIIYHLRKTRVELLKVFFFPGSAVCDSKISACYILVYQFLTFLVKQLQDNIFFLGTR